MQPTPCPSKSPLTESISFQFTEKGAVGHHVKDLHKPLGDFLFGLREQWMSSVRQNVVLAYTPHSVLGRLIFIP